MQIKRIYHHYEKWEDFLNGMYNKTENEEEFIDKAVAFMKDHRLFGEYMVKVTKQWPVSCEQNLTDTSMNRRAWMGQSACCLAIGCPEYITRLAWWKLTDNEKTLANKEADKAIEQWEYNHLLKNSEVQIKMFDMELVSKQAV